MSLRNWIGALAVAGLVLAPGAASAQMKHHAAMQKKPAAHAAAKVDDATLDSRIEARLKKDAALKKNNIDVSVSDGVVTLTGTVHSPGQRTRAGRLARIAGVTRVDNKLDVETAATTGKEPSKTEKAKEKTENAAEKTKEKSEKAAEKTKEKTKDAGEKVKDATSETGEAITDAWITTKVKTQFVGEDALKGSDINVDTNNHVVTLKGTVATAAGRARAVAIAKETKGVTRVVDQLTIATKK
jgi:hyperosmotically inducible protein